MIDETLLIDLLARPERHDVEFKRKFPNYFFDNKHQNYNSARAEVVKDVAAMANAAETGPGYLVYGIQDANGKRTPVPRDASESIDDANFDQFLERFIDPKPIFSYGEFQYEGVLIGLMQIERVPHYPHVIKVSLGDKIFQGQIFVRSGTRIHVALHKEIKEMCNGSKDYIVPPGSLEEGNALSDLTNDIWNYGYISHQELDTRLDDNWEHIYKPSTRRRICIAGNFDGTNPQYLMKRAK